MSSVYDVADYILHKRGNMSAMKLEKLCYYSQAWSLVWDECPLFSDKIEAWKGGPVIPNLYDRHRGQFEVSPDIVAGVGDKTRLSEDECETIDGVLKFYGNKTAQWLSDLTHMEDPWKKARERAGVRDGQSCNERITDADMAEYYSGL